MTVKDHLGHEFHSQKTMAEYWGVKYVTFMHRKNNLHWSVERSLTADLNTNTEVVYDHLGHPYPSMSAMARHYGLGISTLAARLSIYKWPLEKALTTPVGPTGPGTRQVKDHKGKIYPSTKAMAEAYHLSSAALQSRLRRGWPLERALTTPTVKQGTNSKPVKDHKGRTYPSKKAMAEAYHISPELLSARLYLGWPLEKALTTPIVKQGTNSKPVMDYQGKIYPSKKAMAASYQISPALLASRLKHGWSLKKALTTPIKQ